MMLKEFMQLRRDRVTFATIVMRAADAARAVRLRHQHPAARPADRGAAAGDSDVGRSILKALENTKYFKVTHQVRDEAEFDRVLASGEVLFAIEIPRGFERALRRGDRPALLIAADATDPVGDRARRSAR